MISAKPTENLAGITIAGSYDDFYEIVESIYSMTGLEDDYNDPYWSVKNRLLGICYDIRHAYMGDREIALVDSGADDEMMKWHSMVLPTNAVEFRVNIIFTEAVFVALSVPEIYMPSAHYYGSKSKKQDENDNFPPQLEYSNYFRDKAILDLLCSIILKALAEVIGEDELEKLIKSKNRQYIDIYRNYATLYVDRCSVEYLKTAPDKRKDKLRNIAKRFVQFPDAYKNLKSELEYSARLHSCSIHEFSDPKIDFPEEIEW